MVSIIKFQNFCKITDLDFDVFQDLDRELSFKIQGSEFSAAYKGYFDKTGNFVTWDGRRHLMHSNGKFPIGLFERVCEFLKERNVEFKIIEERWFSEFKEIDISKGLNKIGIVPRYYQIDAANKIIKKNCGIIRASTGCGKSVIATLVTSKIGKKSIILVIGTDLLYQMHDLFSKLFPLEIGIVGDGKCEIKDITIASVWTIGKAFGINDKNILDDEDSKEKIVSKDKFKSIKDMVRTSKMVLLDECHVASVTTLIEIFNNTKSAEHLYGMSASPWRDDGSDLLIEAFLGKRVVDISAQKLIKEGFLVKPEIRFIAPKPYKYKSGKYKTIYSRYIIENNQRNSLIVRCAEKMVEQSFVPLILFHNIKHGDILYDKLKDKVPCALLSGKDNSKIRDKIKEELEDGKIKCLLASKIFDIGVDLPILSGLIIAGGGKSSVRALQRIGRVIRPYPGKSMAAVIDFADQAPYLKDHSEVRKKVYEMEFDVSWPQKK